MRILVEEEYGYRYWLWEDNRELDVVIQDFYKLVKLDGFFFTGPDQLGGEWKEVSHDEWSKLAEEKSYHAVAHVHENHDSYILAFDKNLD